jgi:hypothetical protein
MSNELDGHVLYREGSNTPIICERPDWRKCPDHQFLSESPSGGPGFDDELINAANADLVDDPDDDIISVNEYAAGVEVLDKVKTQVDLMEGDSLLRRSYRYDNPDDSNLSPSEKLIADTKRLIGREGERFERMRNKNLYDIKMIGIGSNFSVANSKSTLFGGTVGVCDKCGAKVKLDKEGFWVHKGALPSCPSAT